jgi:AdoMet-dependent heme synthase
MKSNFDINKTPLITIWETTQACDVACLDYRSPIQLEPDPLELSTVEAENLIDKLAELNPPIFVLTGADPLKRSDIFHLLRYASVRGLHPFLALNATPLLTPKAISELKHAGLSRLILNLDGSNEELHDLVCGVHGSFVRTMEALQWADQWRLPCQITTHYCERNLHDLGNLAALLKTFHIASWTIAFPVPTSLGEIEETPSPEQFEEAFALIYALSQRLRLQKRRTIGDSSCSSRPGPGRLPPGALRHWLKAFREFFPFMKAVAACLSLTPVRSIPALHCT